LGPATFSRAAIGASHFLPRSRQAGVKSDGPVDEISKPG
jgi:hypothetical protein